MLKNLFLAALVMLLAAAIFFIASEVRSTQHVSALPDCDGLALLWKHIYHAERLHVIRQCLSVEGVWQSASHGATGDGCRHEKDGDGHCWVKLDEVYEVLLNDKNRSEQDSNLVVEPICIYKTTQQDAKAACKDFHQSFAAPKVGQRVIITGALVLDAEHGHVEIHPVSLIEVLDTPKN